MTLLRKAISIISARLDEKGRAVCQDFCAPVDLTRDPVAVSVIQQLADVIPLRVPNRKVQHAANSTQTISLHS